MNLLFPPLSNLVKLFEGQYAQIAADRKAILEQLAAYVRQKTIEQKPALLNFICTHNSRRSHLSQLWAQAAAFHYDVKNVQCYSGGTEATAFNPRAVKAMREVGFQLTDADASANPKYEVRFAEAALAVIAFSKTYGDSFNPSAGFAAIMTCSHADENCPIVIGAEKRISLPFDDPKDFDDTDLESAKYHERVLEIGKEICFAFSLL
ncbi:MAG: protein-tyrosine-phosphatase [Cyclobacteriaceae bacterium]|nr:protein-tyrosine-phosphatase [Cyclobacteriaceae bacterium]